MASGTRLHVPGAGAGAWILKKKKKKQAGTRHKYPHNTRQHPSTYICA
jgi:hypothetical protein